MLHLLGYLASKTTLPTDAEPQFMDHMRSVSRGRLHILSPASEVGRLEKRSRNKYALLVSKQKGPMRDAHRPLLAVTPALQGQLKYVLFSLRQTNS